MAKLVRLNPEIRDDFVAYLDGELDEAETERIEAVIGQSEVARSDMEGLAKTYEFLDILERPEASGDFAERTMATIRVDELRADPRDSLWYKLSQRGGILAAWVAGLFAMAVLGFLATSQWVQTPSDQLVEDLPLIENIDLYTEVGSIEFLQRLSAQDALLEEMAPQTEEAAE